MSNERPTKITAEELRAVLDDPLALDELDTAEAVVTALSQQSFVRVARRLHDEQRLELVLPHATPEQLTALLDLDAWRGDRIDVPKARTWLYAIADTYTDVRRPRGSLTDLIYKMDPEMWTMALCGGTVVIDLDPEDENARDRAYAELEHLRTWSTPDGFFVVGVPDDELGNMVLHTLDAVYGDDLAEGRKLTLSIQSALPAAIEEDLLRWRAGRLADLGFVGWEEAMRLFRPLDHRAAAEQERREFTHLSNEDGQIGVESLVTWTGSELLKRVMLRLSDAEHGLRSREFLLLVNEVMAAQRFEAGDETLQQRAVDQTQSTLTLGLEMLGSTAPGHPDLDGYLAERLQAIGLRDIFRVGYGALDKLRRAALTLHSTGRVSLTSAGSLLDRPWGPAIGALSRWYPELPLQGTSAKTRPIRSMQDVARATELVAQAGALAQLTFANDGFTVDPIWISRVDEPERLLLGDLVRSAVVHAHLPGSRTTMAPLTPDDLIWARNNLLTSAGQLIDAVTRDFSARCDMLGIGAYTQVLAENLLTRLRVELASLEIEDNTLDMTRVGGFLTIQQVGMWLTTSRGTGERN